ncbi:hypothetical protein [Bacillus suaedaesalsae]|uniref:DUF2986 domain-containing protein n=1 Tax=Bacillus suaedaesalsae TaxID=2810349 RepID=A0ABS2DKC3_9BACI|nr:hypothetical protein [Bacillus suaedaesalsae]MBM6618952.1 hypothetical protein [Bacillus suaedaesalsae]
MVNIYKKLIKSKFRQKKAAYRQKNSEIARKKADFAKKIKISPDHASPSNTHPITNEENL